MRRRAARLERLVGVARDVDVRPDGESAEVVFAGARLAADHVVLALGNYSPANPAAVGGGVLRHGSRTSGTPGSAGRSTSSGRASPC